MTKQAQTLENDVLFQKLGASWYIFTEISGDYVYSALPEGMDPRTTKLELYDVIEDHMIKVANTRQSTRKIAAENAA
jgi:hypothetical protein